MSVNEGGLTVPNIEKDCRALIHEVDERNIPTSKLDEISTQIWKWIMELNNYPDEEW